MAGSSFTSPVAGSFAIFRMEPDGAEITQLNSTYSHFLNPVADSVYYWSVDTSELRRMRVDGSADTVLIDNGVDYVNAADEWIYFAKQADAYNIWRASPDDATGDGLFHVPTDGSGQTVWDARGR
jgi:hypothetical protein